MRYVDRVKSFSFSGSVSKLSQCQESRTALRGQAGASATPWPLGLTCETCES